MWNRFAWILLVLWSAQTATAQTINGDRLRLNTGPCVISSSETGAVDSVLFQNCPKITTAASTNLDLLPTGDLILGPTGSDIMPLTGYTQNLGSLATKYLTLHAAELWVETLVAQNTMATIGGRILVAPTTTLTSDLSTGATTILVKHNSLLNGDRVYLQADGKVEWLAITSAASGAGPYSYTVTRNLDGSGANQWYAGDAVLNTGTTGKGFIDLYSTSGVLSGSGPSIVGNVRTGSLFSDIAPRWAIGNLNGVFNYASEVYGAAFGDAAATNVTIDATNGFRIRSGTTNKLIADTAGNLFLTGDLSLGTNSLFRTASATSYSTGDGFFFSGGSSPQVRIGNPSGNVLTYETSTGFLIINGNGAGLTQIGPGSLTIGAGRNMIRNSDCAVNTGDWLPDTTTGLSVFLGSSLATWRLNDTPDNTCYLTVSGTPAAGTISNVFLSNSLRIPATAGLRYEASAYLGVHRSGNTEVIITFLDSAGTSAVGQTVGNTCTAASAGGTNLSGYCRSGVIATAPSGTYSVRIDIRTTHTAEANPYLFWVHAYLGEAQSGQTLLTPWGPSGMTQITGDVIKTGSIVADNIAVGAGRNMIRNSDCAVNTGDWLPYTTTGLSVFLGSSLATWRLNDTPDNTCYLTVSGTPAAGTISIGFLSNSLRIPATAGLRYEASAYLGVHRSGNTEVLITFLDSAGTSAVGQTAGNTCTAASVGGTNLSGYCRSGVIATAPSGTYSVRIDIRTTHTAEANPYLFWVHAYLGEAQSGQNLLTPWGPSGMTQITGDVIKTGSIVADNIAASTITGSKIAGGTITGSLIAANTITAGNLSVSTLSAITANLGTVTAGTITGVSISGSTITAGGGAVTLDADGLELVAGTSGVNRIQWSNGDYLQSQDTAPSGMYINAHNVVHIDSVGRIILDSGSTIRFPGLAAPSGTRTICIDAAGDLFASIGAC